MPKTLVVVSVFTIFRLLAELTPYWTGEYVCVHSVQCKGWVYILSNDGISFIESHSFIKAKTCPSRNESKKRGKNSSSRLKNKPKRTQPKYKQN